MGKNPIPVDLDMIAQIPAIEPCDEQQAVKYVTNNRHNSITTIYYLILKRHIRKGGKSIADITKYKPEDFQPGASRNAHQTERQSTEGASPAENKVQLMNKNQKASDNEQANQKIKMATQIKLKKDIDSSSKNQQLFPDMQQDVEQTQENLIAITEKNTLR